MNTRQTGLLRRVGHGSYTEDAETRRWTQHEEAPPPAIAAPPVDSEILDDSMPARPAWRTVHKREERRQKPKAKAIQAPPPPPAIAAPEPMSLPAWAQWKRMSPMHSDDILVKVYVGSANPLLSPVPVAGSPSAPLPSDHGGSMARSGLFGGYLPNLIGMALTDIFMCRTTDASTEVAIR